MTFQRTCCWLSFEVSRWLRILRTNHRGRRRSALPRTSSVSARCAKESCERQINVSLSFAYDCFTFFFLNFLPQRNVPGGKGSAHIIGGSDLLVHSRGKNSDLDEWLKDAAEVRRPLGPSCSSHVYVQPLTARLNPVFPSGGASAQARREHWRQPL